MKASIYEQLLKDVKSRENQRLEDFKKQLDKNIDEITKLIKDRQATNRLVSIKELEFRNLACWCHYAEDWEIKEVFEDAGFQIIAPGSEPRISMCVALGNDVYISKELINRYLSLRKVEEYMEKMASIKVAKYVLDCIKRREYELITSKKPNGPYIIRVILHERVNLQQVNDILRKIGFNVVENNSCSSLLNQVLIEVR